MRDRSGVRTLQITFTSNVPLEIKHALSLQHAFTPKARWSASACGRAKLLGHSGEAGAAASKKRQEGEPNICTRPFAGAKGAEGEGAQGTGDWPRAPLLCSKPVPMFHELLPCLSTRRGLPPQKRC